MSNTIQFFLEEILNVLCPEFVTFPPRCGRDNPTLSLIGEVSFETICLQFSKILVNLNHGVNYERVSEWHQRNKGMRGPFGLSPLNFNNMNSCNSTNDSLLNIQTRLKDWSIETSEGRTVEINQGGRKGEDLRLSSQRVSGEGRNQIAAGIPFTQDGAETQSEHSCWSGLYMLWLNPVTSAGTKHRDASLVVWHFSWQEEKQSTEPSCLPSPSHS